MPNQQKINQLKLLAEFMYDLYECAAEPTEDKISAFHSKYNEAKRQELQAAIPFQNWIDKKILADGEAILQKIGAGASLAVVREDLKKAVVEHSNADFRRYIKNVVLAIEKTDQKESFMPKLVVDFVEAFRTRKFDEITEKQFYNEIFLPHYEMIKPYLTSEQIKKVEEFSNKMGGNSAEVAPETSANSLGNRSFTEMVGASRSNENGKGRQVL